MRAETFLRVTWIWRRFSLFPSEQIDAVEDDAQKVAGCAGPVADLCPMAEGRDEVIDAEQK